MNDNIDQIYLINKILQLTERISILEKKMQSYENNNKILFQQSTNNSLNNIQNLNDIEKIYDPINNNTNTIYDLYSNNLNMQNINVNMQNNNINKRINNINNNNDNQVNIIYDPLSN